MSSRAKRILLALFGLLAAFVVSIPLIQQLSVDLLQLQLRERFIDEHKRLADVARDFEVDQDFLIDRLELRSIPPADLQRATLAELATRRGQTLRAFKRDLVAAIFDAQFGTSDYPFRGRTNEADPSQAGG